MTKEEASKAAVGDSVRYWSGIRAGEGQTGTISYFGVYDICGTDCVYIKGKGAMAITHVEKN